MNGQLLVAALLDTGASRTTVIPEFVRKAGLPPCGPEAFWSYAGSERSYTSWIDMLQLGDFRALQVVCSTVQLPGFPQIPPDRQPALVIGGEEIFAGSPVFDLERNELRFRGRPETPLAEDDGVPHVAVPFERRRKNQWTVSIDVKVRGRSLAAMFDLGMPHTLTLTKQALARIGLPADRASWRRRGAVPLEVFGAGEGRRRSWSLRSTHSSSAECASTRLRSC